MNELILYLINIIHILFVLFILIVPFTNSTYLLLIYAIIAPFMMLHWYTNNNICALTVMEKYVRGQSGQGPIKDEDCFTCRVIEPIYGFTNDYVDQALLAYIIVTVLWLIVMFKLYFKFTEGNIKSYDDLMKF